MAQFPSIPTPKNPDRFEPKKTIKRSGILRPSDLRHVLRVIDATSRWPERDSALMLTSHCTGMRCTELARITPRDVLMPSSQVRSDVQLRAEITKGCKARMAYFRNTKLIAALNRYVLSRHDRRIGLTGDEAFAGLYPDAPLFYSSRHGGFALVSKPRLLDSGEVVEYKSADGLEHLFRRLYLRSGLSDCSSHSGRRTFASRLLAQGVSSEDVSKLLGHSDLDITGGYLEASEAMLEACFADVL